MGFVPSLLSTASVVIFVFKALTNLNQMFIYLKELWITLRNSTTLQTLEQSFFGSKTMVSVTSC